MPTDVIYQAVSQLQKKCYTPVITDFDKRTMAFYPYDNETVWHKNRFGIDEPVYSKLQPVDGDTLQLVIVDRKSV